MALNPKEGAKMTRIAEEEPSNSMRKKSKSTQIEDETKEMEASKESNSRYCFRLQENCIIWCEKEEI